MTDAVLSILMLATLALVLGALYLFKKGGHVKQAALMLVLAVVAVLNVAIWTIPNAEGTAPLQQIGD